MSALFCAPESGNSPVVRANITTSCAARVAADSIDSSSVAVTVNSPLAMARLRSVDTAAGIES
jgi:hypothetical protein